MTRLQCEELLPAIKHFAEGGSLWADEELGWSKQKEVYFNEYMVENIIEDKHFEARKAFALGGEVECRYKNTNNPWVMDIRPTWKSDFEYRPKSKEPVYEWQWLFKVNESRYALAGDFYSEVAAELGWIKFEPSKRVKQ